MKLEHGNAVLQSNEHEPRGERYARLRTGAAGWSGTEHTTGRQARRSKAAVYWYIERLEDGHAGKLKGSEGETTAAIRRRLGSAAKYLGKELVVQRVGDQLYFWEEGSPGAPKRRRRKAKSS